MEKKAKTGSEVSTDFQKLSSRYAQSLMETSLDPLVALSVDGKITAVNEAMIKATDVKRKNLIGTNFSEYFTEPNKAWQWYQKVLAQGSISDSSLTILGKDGRRTNVLYNASLYKDAEGKIIGIFAAFRDKTEQTLASQRFKSIIEASHAPLATLSAEGKITDVNEATLKITGLPKQALIGTDFSQYFSDQNQAKKAFQQVLDKGFVTDYPLTVRHRNGELTDVLFNAFFYKDEEGKVLGIFSVVRDETTPKLDSQYDRRLIEASLDPLLAISAEGKITDVNEATIKITGVKRDELIATDFSTYFTEPYKAQEACQKAFVAGFISNYPLTVCHKNGRLTDILLSASIYCDVTGKVLGIFAEARDVTDSQNIIGSFLETKNFLNNILQSSTKYSIIGEDLDHRILLWNEGAIRNYGFKADEIIGKDSSILFAAEDLKSGIVEKMLRDAREKGLAEGDFIRVRKDATRFMASVVITRRDDFEGNPIGYLVMSNDISEKRQELERLKQTAQYARDIIETSLDPFVTISPEGKITDVNEATINVTGVTREGLIGTDFSDYFTEKDNARQVYQQVFAQSYIMDYPLTMRHKDGRLTDVLYNASLYKDVSGKILGIFAAARDDTARKKTELELIARHQRELDRIADLEKFQQLVVGRELKMVELKKEIEELKNELKKVSHA